MAVPKLTPLFVFRKKLPISIRELAVAVKCDRGHLSRVERGIKRAGRDLAQKLEAFSGGKLTTDEVLFPEKYSAGDQLKKSTRKAA